MNKKEVPIWEKSNLTLEEAALYSGNFVKLQNKTIVILFFGMEVKD